MSLELPYGYINVDPDGSSNVDEKYGYYDTILEALESVVPALRKGGRTLGIKQANGKIVEYWWENDNDLSDDGLVIKTGGVSQYYLHDQTIPSATWVCMHNLGKIPIVDIIDSANQTVVAEVTHNSVNITTIAFSGALTGKAIFKT